MSEMSDIESIKNKYPKKWKVAKSTIYKNGKVIEPKETSYKLHTICAVHQVLAWKIDKMLPDSDEKKEILDMLDKCYNYGKRMGDKLKWYHDVLEEEGGWRTSL